MPRVRRVTGQKTSTAKRGQPVADLGDARDGLPRLRTSERGTFKRCRWKWWWEFEANIKGKGSPALRFGSLIHKSLAAWYKPGIKRGVHPSITFEREYQAELDRLEIEFGQRVRHDAEDDEVWVEAAELGVTMLDRYVDFYGKDDEWEVLATEQPFQTVVMHPLHKTPWFIYVGVLDGIWRNRRNKRIIIPDHKSAAAIQLQYLSLDDQATAYWTWGVDWIYAQKLLRPTQKPAGILFNILRKAKWDDRPQNEAGQYLNKDGSISAKQPPPYFARVPIYRDWNERESARERILYEFRDMEAIRAISNDSEPPATAYKNPGQFTCPGCWAFDMCELHEIGSDWQELKSQTAKHWDPYEKHEVYAGR